MYNCIFAQNQPKSCTNPLEPFSEALKNKITSQVKIAKEYFMTSPDIAAGKTFEERTTNLNNAITRTFKAFIEKRTMEYQQVVCHYEGVDWNKAGNSSWRTITCQPGFYFIENTLVHTTNGDCKDGPKWTSNTLKWKTGGHQRSETYAKVDAKYSEAFISSKVIEELNIARKELNEIGIPTEIPPLK